MNHHEILNLIFLKNNKISFSLPYVINLFGALRVKTEYSLSSCLSQKRVKPKGNV